VGPYASSKARRLSSRTNELRGALEAVDRILNRGGDPDDVLRDVLAVLHGLYPYAAIAFVEEGALAPGPARGTPQVPLQELEVAFRDVKVAELQVAPPAADAEEQAFLERVALLISPHCLVGWDTGGVPWPEAG
jgi:hypothetical protein